MKENSIFYIRKFLNKAGYHSSAFVFGEITKSISKSKKKTGKVKENIWRDAELKIADCDRIVSLSMDFHTVGLANNSIYKLDVLIDSLKEFREAFAKEVATMRKKR